MDNREQDPQARSLLDHMVRLLQEVAQHNPNMVERVKLQHISRNLVCIQIFLTSWSLYLIYKQ